MPIRILIVEDEIDIAESIRDILTDSVDEIFIANTAAEALVLVDKMNFHLILLDIMMPNMTGTELLKQLRSKKYNHPVVFLSASDTEDSLNKALQFGACEFITKPFDADALVKQVKRIVIYGQLSLAEDKIKKAS
jgi:DNA-binding response OmpR family regulator